MCGIEDVNLTTDWMECVHCGSSVLEGGKSSAGRAPCQKCGGSSRNYYASVSDVVLAHDGVGHELYRKSLRKKPIAFGYLGHTKDSKGRLMLKEQNADYLNDIYSEKVVDAETGLTLHEENHKLTEHRGRGSAKQKANP